MKKRLLLLLGCCLTLTSLSAQHFTLNPLKDVHPGSRELFSFPYLADSSDAAGRINTWLHGTLLETLPGKFEYSPFERIWPAGTSRQGVVRLGYLVYANNDRYFSLDVSGEYSGIYRAPFSVIHNFDAHSGRPIALEDLFTVQGLKKLQQQTVQQRTALLEGFLKTLDTTEYDNADQYHRYTGCLASVKNDDLLQDRILLTGNSLRLIRNSCSSGTENTGDVLGDLENDFGFETLKPWLSAYGRYLFLPEATPQYAPEPGKHIRIGVYQGIRDGQPVRIFIEKVYNDDSVRAFCYYNEGTGRVDLQTERKPDGSYEFREIGPDQKTVTGIFRLKYNGLYRLEGNWHTPSHATVYRVAFY
ncbi:hypothetical protein [Sinomicrobium oceani]|uniref:hypothetical protein n=1 Tax=Sinomicrobium oceani TaxID=1150368 RepID=UPI00227B8CF6|nr:hypothetical protein [Sinomicrobium oceani]